MEGKRVLSIKGYQGRGREIRRGLESLKPEFSAPLLSGSF